MNSLLRNIIYDEVSKKVKDTDLQKVVSCITYKYASASLNVYNNASSTARSLVESFVPKIKDEILAYQKKLKKTTFHYIMTMRLTLYINYT